MYECKLLFNLCAPRNKIWNNIPIGCVLIQQNSKQVFKYLSQHKIKSSIKTIISSSKAIRSQICEAFIPYTSNSRPISQRIPPSSPILLTQYPPTLNLPTPDPQYISNDKPIITSLHYLKNIYNSSC